MMPPSYHLDPDVAIVGSGFGGALTALALRRLGRSVVLLERSRHPRFAIGESSTPLASLLLEELADRYELPRLRAFSKWGTWRRQHPNVGCGLKRGFSFFRHDLGAAFADGPDHARQLLVAASPHDEIADTHWYRPDFDAFLVREAEAAGAIYLDETTLGRPSFEGTGAVLQGSRQGREVRVRARFVVDASGPRGYLQRTLDLPEPGTQWMPATEGLYTHFENVARFDQVCPAEGTPPYPVDDAALHHVFPGGWIWVLRFANGITSAGAAVLSERARALKLEEGEAAWKRLLAELPSVRAQFEDARAVHPFVYTPRVAARTTSLVGPGWAMLPADRGRDRSPALHRLPPEPPGHRAPRPCHRPHLGRGRKGRGPRPLCREHAARARRDGASGRGALRHDGRFRAVQAARACSTSPRPASARPRGASAVRSSHKASFFTPTGASAPSCAAVATRRARVRRAPRAALLIARIDRAIEPFDVAGLGDRTRHDWYPVRAAGPPGRRPQARRDS